MSTYNWAVQVFIHCVNMYSWSFFDASTWILGPFLTRQHEFLVLFWRVNMYSWSFFDASTCILGPFLTSQHVFLVLFWRATCILGPFLTRNMYSWSFCDESTPICVSIIASTLFQDAASNHTTLSRTIPRAPDLSVSTTMIAVISCLVSVWLPRLFSARWALLHQQATRWANTMIMRIWKLFGNSQRYLHCPWTEHSIRDSAEYNSFVAEYTLEKQLRVTESNGALLCPFYIIISRVR